jgi:hypothetical protein
MLFVTMNVVMERSMKLRTVFLLALIAAPASFSGSAAFNAPISTATPIIQTEATCAAVSGGATETVDRKRKLCSKPIVVAQQTPRDLCIKNCQNIYSGGGEPLQTCIKQCPPE